MQVSLMSLINAHDADTRYLLEYMVSDQILPHLQMSGFMLSTPITVFGELQFRLALCYFEIINLLRFARYSIPGLFRSS